MNASSRSELTLGARRAEWSRRYLKRAIERGRLSHAYLVVGPDGSGKGQLAIELAKLLFCPQQGNCAPCLVCRSIEHGNHPGFSVYGPPEGKSAIDIDTIRGLCDRSHFRRDHAFLAVVSEADRLTIPAANALLKTLEEPPGEFLVMLLARSTGGLLPTIVSRCHRLLLPGHGTSVGEETDVDWSRFQSLARSGDVYRLDAKSWLSEVVPDGASHRGRVRALLSAGVRSLRQSMTESVPSRLDGLVDGLDGLDRLREQLDGNVNPDLILERLLTIFVLSDA